MRRLTSTTGCLRYDPLLNLMIKYNLHTYIYVGVNTVCPIDIVVTLAYVSLRHCVFSASSSRSLSLLLVWMPTGILDLHDDCRNYIELHNILFTYKNNQSLETLLMTADTNPNL